MVAATITVRIPWHAWPRLLWRAVADAGVPWWARPALFVWALATVWGRR